MEGCSDCDGVAIPTNDITPVGQGVSEIDFNLTTVSVVFGIIILLWFLGGQTDK